MTTRDWKNEFADRGEKWNTRAMELRKSGLNVADIARRMTAEGYCTSRGSPVTPRVLGACLKAHGLIPMGTPGRMNTYTPEQRNAIRGVIQECFDRGEGTAAMMRTLNSRGIRTFRNKPWRGTSVSKYRKTNNLTQADLEEQRRSRKDLTRGEIHGIV